MRKLDKRRVSKKRDRVGTTNKKAYFSSQVAICFSQLLFKKTNKSFNVLCRYINKTIMFCIRIM